MLQDHKHLCKEAPENLPPYHFTEAYYLRTLSMEILVSGRVRKDDARIVLFYFNVALDLCSLFVWL
jgi:hypothetical protein